MNAQDGNAVLVADEDREECEMASEALESAGFSVRTTDSCEATNSAVSDRRYDCVVTGAELADGDYRDLLDEVASAAWRIPVVVRSDDVGVADALDAGAADCTGTSDVAELVARVRHLVEDRREFRADGAATRGSATESATRRGRRSVDRRSREELERDSSMLDSLLSYIPVSVYFKDKRGRHLRVSESLTGKSDREHIRNIEGKIHKTSEDVLGKTDFDLYHSETAVAAVADDRYVMETESSIEDKVESYKPVEKYGWRVFTSTSKAPWYDADGELAGTMGVTLDITERKEYEQRLEEQNERLERFATVLTHDLRNPLNVAQGNLEFVAEDVDSERLDTIERSLDRIEVLVEDILELARQGTTVGETERVDLAAVATAAWGTVDTADGMTLEIVSSEPIQADRTRLRRLLENLFRNAREHAGADATVSVGTTSVSFYVEDDGPGIPTDERDRVLEQGFSTSDDGTGFGLAIVRQIADAHGWEVIVDESDAGGARFEFADAKITGCDR